MYRICEFIVFSPQAQANYVIRFASKDYWKRGTQWAQVDEQYNLSFLKVCRYLYHDEEHKFRKDRRDTYFEH